MVRVRRSCWVRVRPVLADLAGCEGAPVVLGAPVLLRAPHEVVLTSDVAYFAENREILQHFGQSGIKIMGYNMDAFFIRKILC